MIRVPHLFVATCVALSLFPVAAQTPNPASGPPDLVATKAPPFVARRTFGAYVDAAGTPQAEGANYRAAFAGAGLRLEVAGPDVTHALATLQLRYQGCARGVSWFGATGVAAAHLGTDQVQFEHPAVTETYHVLATGVEQTFRFDYQPAGAGDLHLHIAVAGNVAAPATGRRHQALEFALAGQPAIRYGEAIAFDRAGRRVDVLTHYDGLGEIQLTVPGSFLDAASYPVVVDPAVGPVFLPAGAANNDVSPDVAHDLEQDLYLVVWQRVFAASNGIRGAIYRGDGTVVNALIPIHDVADCQAPAVAFSHCLTDNAFLVVWQQPSGIRGRMVTAATGALPAASFAISSPGAGEVDRRPSVSGPGDHAMMVAWDRTAAAAATPNEILLLDLYYPIPALPGVVNLGPERTLESVAAGYVQNVRLARSDVATVIGGVTWYQNRAVWQRFYTAPAPGDTDIRTASFRMKAGPFDYVLLNRTTVPGGGDVGPNELLPDIGSRASMHLNPPDLQYLIAWQDEQDVLGHMYDAAGAIGAVISIRATADFEGNPAVGAGHCEFTVAYLQAVPPAEFDVDVYAARVLLDGTVPINHRLVDNPGGDYQDHLRASSRPIISEADPRNTTLLAWRGQTGAGAGLNDVRARFFEPVNPTVSFFGVACPGPAAELAVIGSSGGAPVPGNDDFRVTVTGAPPFSIAALIISDIPVNVPIPGAPGCFLYAGLPFLYVDVTVTDAVGAGSLLVPIPCSIPNGTFLAMQWGIFTPGHNPFGWITSNDMDVLWNH